MINSKSNPSFCSITLFVSVLIAALAAVYGFNGMFERLYVIFVHAQEEDMSFGWFVPVFSLYVLWTKRKDLIESVGSSCFSWWGFLFSLPFLIVALLGTRGVQLRLEQLGFIGLCFTVPWSEQAFLDELQKNPTARYFVLLNKANPSQVIAYGGYWKIFDEGHITNIAVHPDWRNQKAATYLLCQMMQSV